MKKKQVERGDIRWLTPIPISFDKSLSEEKALRRNIHKQIREGLGKQKFSADHLLKGVYVIRLTGSFMIAYEEYDSPVLYVGRGQAFYRVASHIRRWGKDVRTFGHDTGMEILFMLPARRNRRDYFKNVEADLIRMFWEITKGDLPFYNKCRERSFEGKIKYYPNQLKMFRRNLGIGSGKRFRWAIRPTPANRDYKTYWKGSTC